MGRAKRLMEEKEAKQAKRYDTEGVAGMAVCVSHFRNRWLKSWMKLHTHVGVCSYCGESEKFVDMMTLMRYVCCRIIQYTGPMENEARFVLTGTPVGTVIHDTLSRYELI